MAEKSYIIPTLPYHSPPRWAHSVMMYKTYLASHGMKTVKELLLQCHHVSPWCKQHGSEYVKKSSVMGYFSNHGLRILNSRLRRTALKLPATPVKHALYHLFSMALYHLVINSTSIKRINSKSVTSRLFFVLSSPLWLPWVAFIVPQKKLRNKPKEWKYTKS